MDLQRQLRTLLVQKRHWQCYQGSILRQRFDSREIVTMNIQKQLRTLLVRQRHRSERRHLSMLSRSVTDLGRNGSRSNFLALDPEEID